MSGDETQDQVVAAIKGYLNAWYRDGYGRAYLRISDTHLGLYAEGELLYETDSYPHMLEFATKCDARLVEKDAEYRSAISGACTTNSPARPRGRPLDPKVTERRRRIAEMAERLQPATIRQLYYQAEVAGLVPKTDAGYRAVQHDLLILRQQGAIDYDWISDSTRWMRKSRSYKGIDHFLDLSIGTYRRDLWHSANDYVEIWIEKDALAGSVMEVTNPYDVPLMVAKGFSSETYLYEAAQAIIDKGKPAYIYVLFDHDPSGEHSAKHIERRLREFAPEAEIHFRLAGVTEQQIVDWKLTTRETKRDKNRHAKNFIGDSCELDSISPDQLRNLVRGCIERHIDHDRLVALQAAEESEREALEMFAGRWKERA